MREAIAFHAGCAGMHNRIKDVVALKEWGHACRKRGRQSMSQVTFPRWRAAVAALLAIPVIAGCTSPGPYLRTNAVPTDTPRVITTDAKLRNVFMIPPGRNEPNWRL